MRTWLLLASLTAWLPIARAQSPSPAGTRSARIGLTACPPRLPDSQRQLIDAALRRFEKLKPAYASLAFANAGLHDVIRKDSIIQVGQGRIISWYKSAYSEEQRLRQDSNAKLLVWKHKAKKRGLIIGIGIAVPAAYGGYKAYQALFNKN